MDRAEFETAVRRKLKPSPATDRVVAAILLDADEYAAHLAEEIAHPPYKRPRMRPASSRDQGASVATLPGGET